MQICSILFNTYIYGKSYCNHRADVWNCRLFYRIIRFVIWKGRLSAMAEIKDCMNKKIKISKGSITIKDDDNKTCGVVRNIVSLYDLQANKQINYYRKIRDIGLHGKISIRDCIISDGTMYIFRNIKTNCSMKNMVIWMIMRNRRKKNRKVFLIQLKALE